MLALVIQAVTGVNVLDLVGGGSSSSSSDTGTALTECSTGADADAKGDCRMQAAATSLDAFWTARGKNDSRPELVLFSDSTSTGCGTASSATGPFCCPPDRRFPLDTAFFDELSSKYGGSSGSLAQLCVDQERWTHGSSAPRQKWFRSALERRPRQRSDTSRLPSARTGSTS